MCGGHTRGLNVIDLDGELTPLGRTTLSRTKTVHKTGQAPLLC